MPGDVLQHDDGIVHHETGGDGQGHQREVVDRETGQVHHPEGADQRQRHGDRRDDRGRRPAQEQEGHHHHQGNGEQQLVLHVAHGGTDGLGTVGEHAHVQTRRQVIGDRRQQFLDPVDHLDDVGAGLALDVQQDRLVLVGPGGKALVLGAVDDLGDVLQAQRCAIVVLEDEIGVLGRRAQLVIGVEHRHPGRAIEVALGLVDVGGTDQGAHVVQVQAVGRQGVDVDLDPHRLALAAGDADHADATDLGDFLRYAGVDQVVELGQRHGLGRDGQGQHRRVGRVDLVVHRRCRQVAGQQVAGGVDRGLYLLLGDIHVHVEVETQGQHRSAAGAGRGHLLEARHLAELTLQWRGDGAGHHLGAGAGVQGHDADGRVVDLGQGRHR